MYMCIPFICVCMYKDIYIRICIHLVCVYSGFPNVKVYVARRPVLGKFFWFIDLARLVDGERGVG